MRLVNRKLWHIIFFWTAVLMVMPAVSYGEQPIDVLQKNIDEGIRILKDPEYNDPGRKADQVQKLVMLCQELVDFGEFSRLVLADSWRVFTPEQQEEFTAAFAKFLSTFYMRKVQERYNGERVIYGNQRLLAPSKAQVNVEVRWKDLQIPAEVRMVKRSGVWKVYDAIILGIGIMKNYRAQFREIVRRKTPEQVIEMLKEKVEHSEPSA